MPHHFPHTPAVCFFLGMALFSVPVPVRTQNSTLKASAGKIDITPKSSVYLAGYGSNRKSTGVHDPVSARCLVMESGGKRIAFVSCDLIGMPRYQIEKIRAKVKSVKAENLYIAATHVHSGPDTLGQWGPDIRTSGVDKVWMAEVLDNIVRLVEETVPRLQPVTIKFASTSEVPRISKNIRIPQVLDKELSTMQVLSRETGKPVATLVNYACHPEILNNRNITSDFPNWVYQTIECKTGAVCLFLNGALGGMVTADFEEIPGEKGKNWKAAETIGTGLGERVLQILETAEVLPDAPITTQQKVFEVPLENQNFKALIALHIFPKDLMKGGNIVTEVNRITIGPAEFLTFPGEVLPSIGLYVKRLMRGKPKFQLGLTSDELGYILSAEDFGLQLYAYESSVSIGSEMGSRMVQNLRALMEEGKK